MASLVIVERQTTSNQPLPCSPLLFHLDFLSLPTVVSQRENEAHATTLTPQAASALVSPRAPSQSPHPRQTTMHPLCHLRRLLQHPKLPLRLHILTKQSRVSLLNLTIPHIQALRITVFQGIPLPILQCTQARRTPRRLRQLLTSHRQLHPSRTPTLGMAAHQPMLTLSRL